MIVKGPESCTDHLIINMNKIVHFEAMSAAPPCIRAARYAWCGMTVLVRIIYLLKQANRKRLSLRANQKKLSLDRLGTAMSATPCIKAATHGRHGGLCMHLPFKTGQSEKAVIITGQSEKAVVITSQSEKAVVITQMAEITHSKQTFLSMFLK